MLISLSRTSLGLDLGSESLRWVLLRSGLRTQVLGHGRIAVKTELAEHLAELLAALGQRPDVVVASVPATRAYYQSLALPFRDVRKMQAVLPFELEPHLPRPLEGLSTDALPFEGGCVAVALDAKEFVLLQEQLAAAGLGARVLEPDLIAVLRTRLMIGERLSEAGSTVLLELGASKTGFAVLERGQAVRLGALHGGVSLLVEALAEREALSDEEVRSRLETSGLEVFAEVERVLADRFARLRVALRQGRREPVHLVLAGGGALIGGMDRLLARQLGAASVELLDPQGLGPALAGAWGLAHRGLSRAVPCSVRLLSAEPESVQFWTRPRRRLAAALGAAALLLGVADVHQQTASRRARLAALEQQIERMYRDAVPDAVRVVDAPHQLRTHIAELERRRAQFPDPSRDATHPLAVLASLSAAVPAGVKLDLHSYTHSGDVLHLEGEIDGLPALSALQSALSELPLVERLELGTTRKAVSSDRVNFQLDVVLRGAAAAQEAP